ncbi:MAG TPA: immune inhibitor A domain-containing protein, partial [Terriglobales bacterium]|nr:immune inhibitor A domain-containing protein [Terriglobales bacterium]
YLFLSEFNGYGTFAHEMGHAFGLPDLYQYPSSKADSFVGYWSLMDSGNRCCTSGSESTPSYIGGWGATLLGWISPTVVDTNTLVSSFVLKPLESPGATVILIPVSVSTYYFMEYRTQTGKDSALPNSGLLIYFVDEDQQTGKGILKLVSPQTDNTVPPQEKSSYLDDDVFKITDTFSDPSNHVYVAFLGSNPITAVYSPRSLTGTVLETSLEVSKPLLSGAYNGRLPVIATLLQTGLPLGGQSVEIDVMQDDGSWQSIGTTTSDQLGGVAYELLLSYTPGAHTFRLFYPGGKGTNAWYSSAEATFSINVLPGTLDLTLSSSTIALGQCSMIISVKDANGSPVPNVFLTLYRNSVKLQTIKTDADGEATVPLQFAFVDIGSQTVVVKAEAINYQTNQAQVSITLVPIWLITLILALVIAGITIVIVKSRRTRKAP